MPSTLPKIVVAFFAEYCWSWLPYDRAACAASSSIAPGVLAMAAQFSWISGTTRSLGWEVNDSSADITLRVNRSCRSGSRATIWVT